MPTQPQCMHCSYFEPLIGSTDPVPADQSIPDSGLCRRYSPVVEQNGEHAANAPRSSACVVRLGVDVAKDSGWPTVRKGWLCGNYLSDPDDWTLKGCGGCVRWYHPDVEAMARPVDPDAILALESDGQCRHYPPTTSGFPTTSADDWCAQWDGRHEAGF